MTTIHPATPEQMPEPEEMPEQYYGYDHDENPMVAGAEWQPGDPIYARCSSGYARQLFQVLPDVERGTGYWDEYWCHDCEVMWAHWADDPAPAPCWFCGRETPPPNDAKESDLRLAIMAGRW